MIAIATSTFYKSADDVRFKLALEMFREAERQCIQVFAVDESPEEIYALLTQECPGLMRPNAKGMGACRRQAIKAAFDSGADAVTWNEPEKVGFVQFVRQVSDPVLRGTYDLVTPRRSSLASYPRYQQWSEFTANWEISTITNRNFDYFFGPQVMNISAGNLFLCYDGSMGDKWQAIFVPRLLAMRAGLLCGSVTVPFEYPPEQLATEEDNSEMNTHRDTQREQLVEVTRKIFGK